ncbi:MAG: hypothetical protein WDO17_15640 [Alphaproteobacteria bacterium]
MKKINPAAVASGSEVGSATAPWWSHPDLKPVRKNLKRRQKYLLHVYEAREYEVPLTHAWANRSVTVEVLETGPGWIDERALTFDFRTEDSARNPIMVPVRPPGAGWEFECRVAPRSSAWRRRRAVSS